MFHPELEFTPVQGGEAGGLQAGQGGERLGKGLRIRSREDFHISVLQGPGPGSLPPGETCQKKQIPGGKLAGRGRASKGQALQQWGIQGSSPIEPKATLFIQDIQQRHPSRTVALLESCPETIQGAF